MSNRINHLKILKLMDALEFLKERSRLCKSHRNCKGCPFAKNPCTISNFASDAVYKKIIATVEQWSKEHPTKTRQSVFLEQYPEAEIDVNGVMQLCPMPISAAHRDRNGECKNPTKLCRDCRREFWMQEVE